MQYYINTGNNDNKDDEEKINLRNIINELQKQNGLFGKQIGSII